MTKQKTMQYQKAYTELNEILKILSEDQKAKIPKTFKENLYKNMDKSYKFELDISKGIFEQNLMIETEALLVELYEKYLAPQDESELWKRYDKICLNKIEEKKREKCNPDDIFKNEIISKSSIPDKTVVTQNAMIEYKESIFEKIKNWFKNLFQKKLVK